MRNWISIREYMAIKGYIEEHFILMRCLGCKQSFAICNHIIQPGPPQRCYYCDNCLKPKLGKFRTFLVQIQNRLQNWNN